VFLAATLPALVLSHAGAAQKEATLPAPTAPVASPSPSRSSSPAKKEVRRDPARDARAFVALINESRRAYHLRPLVVRHDVTLIGLRWSARMAARRRISHNPRLPDEVDGWELLGENVGWTRGSVADLHRAFLASPKHRKNILDPRFTSIGVGETASPDGRIFVAEEFGWF
jgi:uncharacterized protein YkwD